MDVEVDMKESSLETLSPLLRALRGYSAIEKSAAAAFYLNGRNQSSASRST